jgi:L-serine/L-threonine ammonia-lyase
MNIWLKLENAQNAGSYKIRGLGQLCQHAIKNGCTQFVSSSGGNAGIAAAYAAKKLGVPITVCVPKITPEFMIEKIRHNATSVEVVGATWDDANIRAMELAK